MDKTLLLKAEVREQKGSKSAAKIRKQGLIPAIVYGHKKDSVSISLNEHDLIEGLKRGVKVVSLQLGKDKETAIIKDVQYDYLGKDIIHVDIMRVDVSEKIKVSVRLELKGVAKGAEEGGIIESQVSQLEVECMVTDIPSSIIVSIKELGVGDSLHASDIKLPDGVKLVSDPDLLIAACNIVQEVKTTEELEIEAPTAPEVITERKPKEGEEAEAGEEKKE
jgi:large subunit ribosomal protein L25